MVADPVAVAPYDLERGTMTDKNNPTHVKLYVGKQFKVVLRWATAEGLWTRVTSSPGDWRFRIAKTKQGRTYSGTRKITIPEWALLRGRDYALAYMLHETAHVLTPGHVHDATFWTMEERLLARYDLEIVRLTKGRGSKEGYAQDILTAGVSLAATVPVRPLADIRKSISERQAIGVRLQTGRAAKLGLTLEQYRNLHLRPGRNPTDDDIRRVKAGCVERDENGEITTAWCYNCREEVRSMDFNGGAEWTVTQLVRYSTSRHGAVLCYRCYRERNGEDVP